MHLYAHKNADKLIHLIFYLSIGFLEVIYFDNYVIFKINSLRLTKKNMKIMTYLCE